jgi:hypothetical protein
MTSRRDSGMESGFYTGNCYPCISALAFAVVLDILGTFFTTLHENGVIPGRKVVHLEWDI